MLKKDKEIVKKDKEVEVPIECSNDNFSNLSLE